MSCTPTVCRCGECDIRALRPFVAAFNERYGNDYRFERRLDDVGVTKQPEARYVGSEGALVIERKSLIWPKEYAKFHQTMHEISTAVSERVNEALDSRRAYKLTITDGMRVGRSERRAFAETVASTILANLANVHDGRTIGSYRNGREWQFCEEPAFEREYYEKSTGLKFEFTGSLDPLDWGEIPDGLVTELSRLLSEADKKFMTHADARTCVVLDPYGSLRWSIDETWRSLLGKVNIPTTIDEIWMSMHDQLTDLAFGWIHQRLWPTMIPETHAYCRAQTSNAERAASSEEST